MVGKLLSVSKEAGDAVILYGYKGAFMLKGKYVTIRAIEKDDLPHLLEWRNKPEYRKYFREFRELSMVQQHSWYENIVLKDKKASCFQ